MASGKISLRQKMINLMYLVFIAIVAISVSENVLIQYKETERGLDRLKKSSEEKNSILYNTLKVKSDNDAEKFGGLHKAALEIKNNTTQVVESIDQIKTDMLEMEKIQSLDEDIQYSKLENDNAPYSYFFKKEIFLSNKKPNDQGLKLINEINFLRNYLLDFINREKYKNKFMDLNISIPKILSTEDSNGRYGGKVSWLEGKFYDTPLISTLTTLTQLQVEIRSLESDIVSRMLEGHLSSEISYSNYSTLLDTKKSAFFTGEKFDGSIALGRSDKTTKPSKVEIILDGKPLSKNNYSLEGGEVVLNFFSRITWRAHHNRKT